MFVIYEIFLIGLGFALALSAFRSFLPTAIKLPIYSSNLQKIKKKSSSYELLNLNDPTTDSIKKGIYSIQCSLPTQV